MATGFVLFTGTWAMQASILAQWTFETSVPSTAGPFTAENGVYNTTSAALGFHASASTVYSNPAGAGSAESFSADHWAIGDYFQFATSTLGYSGVQISFEASSSSTGPVNFKFAYSPDGQHFTDSNTYTLLGTWSSNLSPSGVAKYSFPFDLSTVAALDNQTSVYFRLIDDGTTAINGGTVGTGGSSRVDDFTISADPIQTAAVPEPSTWLAGALALLPVGYQGIRRVCHRRQD